MRLIAKPYYFLINSNVYISLAAVALTIQTQIQLGMKPQLHPYLLIVFCATFFEYNVHRLVSILLNKDVLNTPKHSWVKQHLKSFYVLVAISVLCFVVSIFYAKKQVLISLFPMGLITLFYSLPVYKNGKNIFRLREIPALKIFLIALVWSVSTILLPILQAENLYEKVQIMAMLVERFLFVFAITIPFDIRDMASDKAAGLKTIPLLISERKSIWMANMALLLFFVISFFHYFNTSLSFILPGLLVSALSTLFFIHHKKIKQNKYYYYGILDGTMLYQGLLVLTCYFLNVR